MLTTIPGLVYDPLPTVIRSYYYCIPVSREEGAPGGGGGVQEYAA